MTTRMRREDGATMVEFALVSIVVFFLMFAMAEVGLAVIGKTVGTNAARDGARVGIINYEYADVTGTHIDHNGDSVDNHQAIVDAVEARLVGLIEPPTVTVRCLTPGTLTTKSCLYGTVDVGQDLIEVKVVWQHTGFFAFVNTTTHTQTARMVINGPPDTSTPPPPPDAAPTVSSIAIASTTASPTNAGSVSWTVTFSKSVTGVTNDDFALAPSGVTGAAITSATGSGTTWTVTANTGAGNGTLNLNVVDNDSIIDSASRPLGGTGTSGTGDGSFTGEASSAITIDKTAPTATGITRADTNPSGGGTVSWTVNFSEGVTGIDTGDFTLVQSGLPSSSITSVTAGAGSSWTVTASTGTGSGTLGLNLVNNGIKDLAGNNLTAGLSNQASWTYTVTDTTAPQLTTLEMFDNDADGKVDQVKATFSETLAAYSAGVGPWTLINSPSGALSSVSVATNVATLTITEGATANTAVGSFEIRLSANGSGIRDAAGNQSSFSDTAPTDKAKPVVTGLTSSNGGSTAGKAEPGDTITATFSETLAVASFPTSSSVSLSTPNGNDNPVTLSLPGFSSAGLNLGISPNYLKKNGGTVAFSASAVSQPAPNQARVTLSSPCPATCVELTTGSASSVSFTPATGFTDTAGNAVAATALTVSLLFF